MTDLVTVPTEHAKVAVKALEAYEGNLEAELQFWPEYDEEGFRAKTEKELKLAGQFRRVLQVGIDVARERRTREHHRT